MTDWIGKLDGSNELIWYGQGSGGGWHVHVRKAAGGYELAETLEHDSDPSGGASPDTTRKQLDANAARGEVAQLVAQHGQPGVRPIKR
jgi:hypothetical protein